MGTLLSLLVSLALAQPATETPPAAPTPARPLVVEFLDGQATPADGLLKIAADAIEVSTPNGPQSIPVAGVQSLKWNDAAEASPSDLPVEVQFTDGSVLHASSLRLKQRMAEIEGPLGAVIVPSTALRTVRLAPGADALAGSWADLAARDSRNDLLVVRKGDALDFVGGVIGEVTNEAVKLLVRDREVSVPRARVFGLVFVKPAEAPAPAMCEVQTLAGDRLRTKEPQLDGKSLSLQLLGQSTLQVPLDQVAGIDFTLGRVKSLADLPMEAAQFAKSVILTPTVFEVRKNHTSLGQPLRIGDRDYSRGLWMHSGVAATFRLGREYRQLTGVLGIDANSPELPRIGPKVKVVISGDGKVLFESEVVWNDEPRKLDVSVEGVRDLEIRVEPPQETPSMLEHLDIGDARVIK